MLLGRERSCGFRFDVHNDGGGGWIGVSGGGECCGCGIVLFVISWLWWVRNLRLEGGQMVI